MRRTRFLLAILPSALLSALAASAWACPFCSAVKPTLAGQRDAAIAAFVGEAVDSPRDEKPALQSFKVIRALKGTPRPSNGTLRLTADIPVKKGSLVLLFGNNGADAALQDLQWTAVPLDEAAFAYVMQSPDLRQPSAKRLAFFSRFLEHPNRLLADDAYQEFAHATYDQTAEAAARLSMSDLRRWLADPHVPPERKGFYALDLGFAKSDSDRGLNRKLLREQIAAPANDFRAGFDGMLAGYLLLDGRAALELIESRYLANPKSADGDVRSALKALRFYHDSGREIPADRVAEAVAQVLDRPEFAAEALPDLARWKYWKPVSRMAEYYDRKEYSDPFTRRAIVGYLKACPEPAAATALERLRRGDPKGVEEAEKYLSAR
ncbi:MAG TPA: hypothetical protein VKB78_12055 [Pirellulales bacterium]|nr:hypothetical protein [Pirellulales bacterium]